MKKGKSIKSLGCGVLLVLQFINTAAFAGVLEGKWVGTTELRQETPFHRFNIAYLDFVDDQNMVFTQVLGKKNATFRFQYSIAGDQIEIKWQNGHLSRRSFRVENGNLTFCFDPWVNGDACHTFHSISDAPVFSSGKYEFLGKYELKMTFEMNGSAVTQDHNASNVSLSLSGDYAQVNVMVGPSVFWGKDGSDLAATLYTLLIGDNLSSLESYASYIVLERCDASDCYTIGNSDVYILQADTDLKVNIRAGSDQFIVTARFTGAF